MQLGPQLYTGNHYPEVKPLQKIGTLICKPDGGLWTSTYDEESGSGWVQWCFNEQFNVPSGGLWEGFLFQPRPDARIYVVDTYPDCEALFKKYSSPLYKGSGMQQLDFIRISEEYDAVHLTDRGQWATRMTHPYTFYGWDCESTVWLRDVFTGPPQSLGFKRFKSLND
jgi:hypothetical protein